MGTEAEMNIPRRYVRTATVLTIALATGHIMQNADAIAARFSGGPESEAMDAAAAPMTLVADLAQPSPDANAGLPFPPGVADIAPSARMAPDFFDPDSVQLVSLDTGNDAMPEAPALPQPQAGADCTPILTAMPAAGAMVALTLAAPCAPNAEVRIAHAGLEFKLHTDARGGLTQVVPAMALSALFSAVLADGTEAEARIEVPTLAGYDRIAVSWGGGAAIELHAFEFGADYGDPGHVWRGNPRSASDAAANGGYLSVYGDPDALVPLMTEVYTFPAGQATRPGLVGLTLEAEVTPASCGHEIAAYAVTIEDGKAAPGVSISLVVPDCDAVGDFLVLNNLFPDLTVAGR
jgi:hypothetical protein